MFKLNDNVRIKSSGTLGVVVEANLGDIIITTPGGTFPYSARCAKRYLELVVEPCLPRETETTLRNAVTGMSLKDMQQSMGVARAAAEFTHRATGRTLGIALSLISKCIEDPYIFHVALDHHTFANPKHSYSQVYQEASKILRNLGLKGFEFNPAEHAIRFVPIVKEVTTYEKKTVTSSLR